MDTLTTTLDSTNTLTASEAAFAGGLIGSILVIGLIFLVLIIIAEWKIFEKAGEKGWKSIIPIYSTYILFKIIGAKTCFWVMFCLSIVASVLMTVNNLPIDFNAPQAEIEAELSVLNWGDYIPYIIGMVLTCALAIFCGIFVAVRLAKAFGKGAAYIIGLIFVPEIVLLVLGFGKAKYSKKAVKA